MKKKTKKVIHKVKKVHPLHKHVHPVLAWTIIGVLTVLCALLTNPVLLNTDTQGYVQGISSSR